MNPVVADLNASPGVMGQAKPHSRFALVSGVMLLASVLATPAQWMVSGNEAKIDLTSGAPQLIPNAGPDSLTLLNFKSFPPQVEHLTGIPNTVIGPPSNIAISPDGHWALIADSIRLDPKDPAKWVPHDRIHILDLTSKKVTGGVTAGLQPSGISIRPDGRLALVANRAAGTVSVLKLNGGQVSVTQTVEVCEPELSVSDVAISPDGKQALASVQKGGYLAEFKLDGDTVTLTGRKYSVYGQPYRCVITGDGAFGLTAGQGFGNGLDADALSVVDLKAMRVVDHVALGAVPESIEVSPDGSLVAAVLMSGSNLPANDPGYADHGGLVLLARQGGTYVKVQELKTGRIPEGVAFTSDGRHLVVQAHPQKQLWIYAVQGRQLVDTGVRIDVPGMPSSLRASP
jgi:DNA-binding beta-propeller fold protein YncE